MPNILRGKNRQKKTEAIRHWFNASRQQHGRKPSFSTKHRQQASQPSQGRTSMTPIPLNIYTLTNIELARKASKSEAESATKRVKVEPRHKTVPYTTVSCTPVSPPHVTPQARTPVSCTAHLSHLPHAQLSDAQLSHAHLPHPLMHNFLMHTCLNLT